MSTPPKYFDKIREGAARRWVQLEQDPELAGPWHQLFKQVQSPRHILSELLQNADDAGATEASVRIEYDTFIFEHNGEDFSEEHFASICRFGYSNKRALHTIGFRGIGFKSTFSLGGQVELYTPTLSVSFDRKRFTEPIWLGNDIRQDGKTCIKVDISDHHRLREVGKNLEEWMKSPVSLLFFKNIRRMRIGGQVVHWTSIGQGPVPDSHWLALQGNPDDEYLLVRSPAENFPEEALKEIKQERMLGIDDESDFPPCKIEILLGAEGRLFVVLPTGVETTLPFACNAPFIQDPARLKIKDPETSATNRWLLERAGKLAAETMLTWLQQADMTPVDRIRAYGLFPDGDRDSNPINEICRSLITDEFMKDIDGKKILLTVNNVLTRAKQSVMLPRPLFNIWSSTQISSLFDLSGLPVLTRHVEVADRRKLLKWKLVDELSKETFLQILQSKHLPLPASWQQLLNLWSFIAPEVTDYWRHKIDPSCLRIVPVQGKEVLYSAAEIVSLSEKKMLLSKSDWEFLSTYLIVFDQNWMKFLVEHRSLAEEQNNIVALKSANSAWSVMSKIGLDATSDVSKVIDRFAAEFFTQQSISLAHCVQLAQISAKFGAIISNAFLYVTKDCSRRSIANKILFDADGSLDEFMPEQNRNTNLLHPDYIRVFTSCTSEEWNKWISSGRAGLFLFVPFIEKQHEIFGSDRVQDELQKRGLNGKVTFQYSSTHFLISDWDFDDSYWRKWETMAITDNHFWGRIAERIIDQSDAFWSGSSNARALHISKNRCKSALTSEPLLPSWILKLRDLPCLLDSRGFYHKPGDLLRRTPETEALLDVEPFVNARLDNEATRPLLELLGVRSTPTGPDRLLDCLRALSKAENPPGHEVEKWYCRLDQLVDSCSTTDLQNIKKAFRIEKLILTAGGTWSTSKSVFIAADDEDVPGAEVIRSSVGNLTLWRKIDVSDRPTAELAIQWLQELPSRKLLSPDDARRVRALLLRHPTRIWDECGHWLNLAGEWVPIDDLSYSLTMQSLVSWGHLHEWVKQKTANLRSLSNETATSPPFSSLRPLANEIEDQFHRDIRKSGSPERKPWLAVLGDELCRIELDDELEARRVRTMAFELANTDWQNTPGMEILPYIDGKPAGTPRKADVVWLGRVLHIDGLSKAKLAKRVPEELGKFFVRADIKAALDYSFERTTDDIRVYLEENFNLAPRIEIAKHEIQPDTDKEEGLSHGEEKEEPFEINSIHPEGSPKNIESESMSMDVSTDEPEEPETGCGDEFTKPGRQEKPHKTSIIERFAMSQGFRKESGDRYFHANGSWLTKTSNGTRFPWEMRSATGSLLCYYLPKDHCLQLHPLQLDAEVWGLIDSSPDTYTLVLADSGGRPEAMPGTSLRKLKEEGKLKLYPATYRLVVECD